MSNFRNVSDTVSSMKQEINVSIERIKENGYIVKNGKQKYLPEAKRKVKEAKRFLETIAKVECADCITVGELKSKLELVVSAVTKQMNIAKSSPVIYHHSGLSHCNAYAMRAEKAIAINAYLNEINWLKKCIAIVDDKDYFDI